MFGKLSIFPLFFTAIHTGGGGEREPSGDPRGGRRGRRGNALYWHALSYSGVPAGVPVPDLGLQTDRAGAHAAGQDIWLFSQQMTFQFS